MPQPRPRQKPYEAAAASLMAYARVGPAGALARRAGAPVIYSLLLLAGAVVLLARWPIVAGDSDLWLYLSAGRRLYETGSIPADSYYSFVEPPRPWDNYSWLVEAVFYPVFTAFGYQGLALLKALLFGAAAVPAWLLLFRDGPRGQAPPRGWAAAIFALALVVVIDKYKVGRPHVFTYALMAAFMCLLELRPRRAFWLIPLAVLWGNLHGRTYPAMFLVAGAYIADELLPVLTGRGGGGRLDRRLVAALLLCLAAVFLTPLGPRLIAAPFVHQGRLSGFIGEYTPPAPGELLTVNIVELVLTHRSAFALLLAAAAASALTALAAPRGRVGPLLMAAGGALLLSRGSRFMTECALLSLPLLRATPPIRGGLWRDLLPGPARVLAALLLMAPPALLLKDMFEPRPRYPFSGRHLPQGVAAFLERADTGGKVLNFPNTGSYLHWMIHPRYRIFADMTFPNVFTPEDFYWAQSAFLTAEGLAGTLARYAPDYISAPRYHRGFRDLIARHPDYVPVFFDDVDVLYVDRRRHPGLAREHGLSLDPYALDESYPPALPGPEAPGPPLPAFLERMIEIDPSCLATRMMAIRLLMPHRAWSRVLDHGRAIADAFPELPAGFVAQGDALRGQGAVESALDAYRRALDLADPGGRRFILRKMASAQMARRDYRSGYALLRRAVDPDNPAIGRRELYYLATAAMLAHEEGEAGLLFERLYTRLSPPGTDSRAAAQADVRAWGLHPPEF